MVMQRLKEAAEKAKIELSSTKLETDDQLAVPDRGRLPVREAPQQQKLSRAKFEAMVGEHWCTRTLEPVQEGAVSRMQA